METRQPKTTEQYSSEQRGGEVWRVEEVVEVVSVSGTGRAAKSYTCSFCKKGFSNAQALGGHMNIHRKDRAKLRDIIQSSEETSTTLSSDSIHHHVSTTADDIQSQVSDIIVLESSTPRETSRLLLSGEDHSNSGESTDHV